MSRRYRWWFGADAGVGSLKGPGGDHERQVGAGRRVTSGRDAAEIADEIALDGHQVDDGFPSRCRVARGGRGQRLGVGGNYRRRPRHGVPAIQCHCPVGYGGEPMNRRRGTGWPGSATAGRWLAVTAVPLAEPQAAAAITGIKPISQRAHFMGIGRPALERGSPKPCASGVRSSASLPLTAHLATRGDMSFTSSRDAPGDPGSPPDRSAVTVFRRPALSDPLAALMAAHTGPGLKAVSWVGLRGLEPLTSSLSGSLSDERHMLRPRPEGLTACPPVTAAIPC